MIGTIAILMIILDAALAAYYFNDGHPVWGAIWAALAVIWVIILGMEV